MRTLIVALLLTATLCAQSSSFPALYLLPSDDHFDAYLSAAMLRKKVPVTLVSDPSQATLTMKTAPIEVQKVSTGAKAINCLFAYCGGNEDKASTAVQVTDASGAILWSYTVFKGRGAGNRQSMAEAIAKHFANDYLKKR